MLPAFDYARPKSLIDAFKHLSSKGFMVQAGGTDLFVGDTLFAGSIGRTDLPGGSQEVLLASIRNVLFPLGDQSIVYPGHGPTTTIGEERQNNPFLTGDDR